MRKSMGVLMVGVAALIGPCAWGQSSQPKLQFGQPARSRERDVTIPVHFIPSAKEPAGSIRAEATLPSGPWKFLRAEIPSKSNGMFFARERSQSQQDPGKGKGTILIELSASADSGSIPAGLLGYLRFRLDTPDSPLPAGLVVSKLETSAPTSKPDKSEGQAPKPSGPIPQPMVTCFFFSH